jgi:hypothetical protein
MFKFHSWLSVDFSSDTCQKARPELTSGQQQGAPGAQGGSILGEQPETTLTWRQHRSCRRVRIVSDAGDTPLAQGEPVQRQVWVGGPEEEVNIWGLIYHTGEVFPILS